MPGSLSAFPMVAAGPRASNPGGSSHQARLGRRELETPKARRKAITAWAVIVAGIVLAAAATAIWIRPGSPPHASSIPNPLADPTSDIPMHIHSRLSFFSDGAPVGVPAGIGLANGVWADHSLDTFLDPREGAQGQLSPLHTHNESGYIHVEARVTRAFTLGEFFDVWGKPLGLSRTWDFVADAGHEITLTVDGKPSTLWGELVLQDNQQIEIRYATRQ